MSQISLLQEMNAQFVDYEPSPKAKGVPDDKDLPDVDRVVKRVGVYANCEMEWIELSVNWMPFIQTGPRERKFWSKQRLTKALDQAEAEGLLYATDKIGSRFRLTDKGIDRLREIPA